ncbi:hypothetical protein [Devosia alba]|uniref:hypothetical protein n=1 Tax=Devosia alba TaxID=3152360 RepID=UPI0032652EDD
MAFGQKITARLVALLHDLFGPQPEVAQFAAHNGRVFARHDGDKQRKSVVLVEFNEMHSAHIAYSYLANVLANEHDASIVAHFPHPLSSIGVKLRARIGKLLNRGSWRVYRSFGVTSFLEIKLTPGITARARALLPQALAQINSKSDLENLTLEGVWIGDLIYDTFLMTMKQPTVELNSPLFRDWLLRSLETFAFWLDYFDRHDVRAVNVSHCVYNTAMPLRIAVGRAIPAFQINATHAYRLTKDRVFAYGDYFDFPRRFAALPAEVREAGLAEAKARIERRFSGEVGIDMAYSTRSAYGSFSGQRLLRESDRPKVLIATHCFFDSPHSYGNNLFPDFWEWLEYLGKLSGEVDFDWYIKTHPDYLPGTKEIIDDFIRRHPNFTLLPAHSSHNQIIAEGVSAVLTVYGTIGFEYAAKGIKVINASSCNPHIAYDFNIHPRNLDEYADSISNISSSNFKINERKVFEYYYMKNIFNTENYLLPNYAETISLMGGYDAQFTPAIYAQWVKQWTPERHAAIIAALERFTQSSDFRLDYTHFDSQEPHTQHALEMDGQARNSGS